MKPQQPNCHRCRYFYVTWENSHPYGCKRWEFKSPVLPSREVFNASGQDCQFFAVKDGKPQPGGS